MIQAQKPSHANLESVLNGLKDGRYVIPNFQRDFEWKPWDISALVRSIFLDYYVGSLLLWKGKEENFSALNCEPVYGFIGNEKKEHIVLDGQQRLTAIFYAFTAPDTPLPNRASRAVYFIKVDEFMNENYDEAFTYDWLSKRFQKTMDNVDIQYEKHVFPLSVIGEGGFVLAEWVLGYKAYWENRLKAIKEDVGSTPEEINRIKNILDNAVNFGLHVRNLVSNYQISFIELDRELALDKICDIFTQINSRGVRLDVFDLMNALLIPKGIELKHMWRREKSKLEFVDSDKMNVYVLQVMSILKQAYCSPKYLYYLLPNQKKPVRDEDGTRRTEVLVKTTEDFTEVWDTAIAALEKAIKLIKHPLEFGVSSSKYLPYVSILPAFASLQSYLDSQPDKIQLSAQRKISHWYWASVFLNRYSGSVESTSSKDFIDMKEWIKEDDAEPSIIDEFKTRYKDLELRKELKRGSSIYNGIFNLFVLNGARDWFTGNVPEHDDLDDHHIVTLDWGNKNLKDQNTSIHTILNRTPLTSDTNRRIINSDLPNEYLPEMIETNGREKVERIMETHFISSAAIDILLRNPFTPDDFEEFITERENTLKASIDNLIIKERITPPVNLREIDSKVEKIELSLRELILQRLIDNDCEIPHHIETRVNERIAKAIKKNAALDSEYYKTLKGTLEYFDLRELQSLMESKSNWKSFEPIFNTKEALILKFDQLAELRNSIRHSRQVEDVVIKEGEAAVIWFERVLTHHPQHEALP